MGKDRVGGLRMGDHGCVRGVGVGGGTGDIFAEQGISSACWSVYVRKTRGVNSTLDDARDMEYDRDVVAQGRRIA